MRVLNLIQFCLSFLIEGIPPDGTPFEDIVTVPVPFTVVMYILTSVGVVFTIFCLVFVIYFRKTK